LVSHRKWLIAKGRPIKEEDLDVVDEAEGEDEVKDLKAVRVVVVEEAAVEVVVDEEDLREERKMILGVGYL